MDEEEDYELQPPAPPRRDTITRQLQREILGEINGYTKEQDPTQFEQKTEEDEPPSTPSKRRTLSPSKAAHDSFTNVMFAPNLLEQDELKRATLDPVEAASVVAELQKESWTLSNSALDEEDTDSDNQIQARQSQEDIHPIEEEQIAVAFTNEE
eukprot:jgi/Phyca11/533972/estExt2_fgenesh1_pg.C_PHYCAscaffold_190060